MRNTNLKNVNVNVNALSRNLNNLKEILADTSEDVKERANNLITNVIDTLKDKSDDYHENISDYVVEKPFKSIGFALMAGIILGKIIL
jgi:ElaB/YqjD/DUF883 family membrane-anchored ribosome-binding protein